jgi:hypothetical protein
MAVHNVAAPTRRVSEGTRESLAYASGWCCGIPHGHLDRGTILLMVADEQSLEDAITIVKPDLVVVDLSLANAGEANVARRLMERHPVLSVHARAESGTSSIDYCWSACDWVVDGCHWRGHDCSGLLAASTIHEPIEGALSRNPFLAGLCAGGTDVPSWDSGVDRSNHLGKPPRGDRNERGEPTRRNRTVERFRPGQVTRMGSDICRTMLCDDHESVDKRYSAAQDG